MDGLAPQRTPHGTRPVRLHRLWAMLMCWAALLLGPAPAVAAIPAQSQGLQLQVAEFRTDAQSPWQRVELPDTWSYRGLANGGAGQYRLEVDLGSSAPIEVWALRAERMSTHHEVRINGVWVRGHLGSDEGPPRPMPTLVSIPAGLLHAGVNEVWIDVRHGSRAGLSDLVLGPEAALEPGYTWSQHRSATLAQLANAAGAAIGIFVLSLWAARRSEVVLGSFGALALLASLRNLSYYPLGPSVSLPNPGFWFFAAQVASVWLLGWFAMAFAGRRPAWFARLLNGSAALLLPAGLVVSWLGDLQPLRGIVYPWLLLLTLPALGLIGWRTLQPAAQLQRLLPATLLLVLGSALHDYLYQMGHTSIMDSYWLPYTVPLTIAGYAAVLTHRLVQVMAEGERLNLSLERRVAERTRELQAANAAKTRFLATASHDLRQPMMTIGLLTSLLREQALSPALRQLVERLQEASAAMDHLLRGLLDLSRLESGTVRPRRAAVALQPLFEAVARQCDELAMRKGLRLILHPTTAVVDSDPVLLEQVLANLVGNAVRYTEAGGVLVGVRRAGAGQVRLQVIDTGPGIPQEAQLTIFDEFVQLDTPVAARSHGVGLGLAIVKRSLALLEAPLELRSEPGRGSRFSITLERARSAEAQQLPTATTAPRAAPPAAHNAAHVTAPMSTHRAAQEDPGELTPQTSPAGLLVHRRIWHLEDDEAAREALRLRLERWGAQVLGVADLAQWRQLISDAARHPPPDLLICDRHLPDGDGLTALDDWRRLYPGTPVLVVTGDTAPTDLQTLAEAGVPLLHKPFSSDELLSALLTMLPPGAPDAPQ
ncbi:MAG: hybrid sensor histidine kinase/response regulator [Burkholderiales bacterium]|nr:hybrid sensor histidine kinase/response regulator [Burkholderiales bacterium]